ncbi:MAG: PH domain-containing protein [Muribaculaceae bacterium]|nr:PH domain-containing protein [Muribaculaceae bacterium]MDE7110458.1 PH domain-containing protein [Muribaculaceae bacterium]
MTAAFIGSIYLCYQSTWVLLIDVVLMGAAILMLFDMLLHTDYTINGEKLHIRCGFLFRMDLPVSKIIEITHKSTILSSPALSAKRIGLKYGKKRWVYVSPENQEEFISILRSINPAIILT